MTPHRDKLVATLRKKGISFQPTDGHLPNVVFELKGKVVKISYHSFYRFSGIATIKQEAANGDAIFVPMTDDMFMNMYMKMVVEMNFREELKTVK